MRVRLTPLAVAYYMEEDYKYDRDGSSLTPTVYGTVIHVNKRKSVQVLSDERGRQAAYYDADFVEPIYDQPAPESILNVLAMPKQHKILSELFDKLLPIELSFPPDENASFVEVADEVSGV